MIFNVGLQQWIYRPNGTRVQSLINSMARKSTNKYVVKTSKNGWTIILVIYSDFRKIQNETVSGITDRVPVLFLRWLWWPLAFFITMPAILSIVALVLVVGLGFFRLPLTFLDKTVALDLLWGIHKLRRKKLVTYNPPPHFTIESKF